MKQKATLYLFLTLVTGGLGLGGCARGTSKTARNPGVSVKTNAARVFTSPVTVEPVKLGHRIMPSSGKVFLLCNVTATCEAADSCEINGNEFRLTANNRLYNSHGSIPPIGDPPQIRAKLLKGGSITGDVMFEVDSDVTTGTVEYYRHWLDTFHAPQ